MESNYKKEDKELIKDIQQGNTDSFEVIYKKYTPRILRFVNRIIRSEHQSEEIVQDTFLKLYKNINKYKITEAKFSTYLYTIAYNTALNAVKKIKKEKELINELSINFSNSESKNNPHSQIEEKELKQIMEKIISSLPVKEKTIYLFKSNDNMKYEEIAQILNISRRTAIRKMNSALKRIYKEIQRLKII